MLTSEQAAAVCQITAVHLHRLGRAVGIEPVLVPMGRTGRRVRRLWPVRHLFGLTLLYPLRKLGVEPASSIVFARGMADQPCDEAFEAVLDSRPYALVVAPSVCPHTVDEAAVLKADAYRGEELRRRGRDLIAVDLRTMLADLRCQIRAVTEGADATKP